MSEPRIESARDFAARHEDTAHHARATAAVVRARDEQIATVAVGLAEGAEREVKRIDDAPDDDTSGEGTRYCEGQAVAFRAIAAMLRGGT